MNTIVRHVADLGQSERRFYEQVLGVHLVDEQRLLVMVLEPDADPAAATREHALRNVTDFGWRASASAEGQGMTSDDVDDLIDEAVEEVRRSRS